MYKHILLTTLYICSWDSFGEDYKINKLKQKYPLSNWLPPNSNLLCSHFMTVLPPLYDSATPTLRQYCPHFTTILPPYLLMDLLVQGSVTLLILYGHYTCTSTNMCLVENYIFNLMNANLRGVLNQSALSEVGMLYCPLTVPAAKQNTPRQHLLV